MLEQLSLVHIFAIPTLYLCITLIRIARSSLSPIPGPQYSRFTELWLMIQELTGNRRLYIHELHKKHGPVVRLGPNELSFTSVESVKEIYTSGGSGYDKTEYVFVVFRASWI
jgi:hypothetical protein